MIKYEYAHGTERDHLHKCPGASLVTQTVKNPPAMQETQVQSLGWEDPLEEEVATHSSILAWKNPMHRGDWQATVHGVTKSQTQLSDLTLSLFHFINVLLKFQGGG